MIELKKDFTKNDELFIYKCTSTTYGYKYFEVFKRKVHKADAYHNDEYEVYPCNEDFGKWAYACPNAKSIVRTFNEYQQEYQLPMTYADLEEICR